MRVLYVASTKQLIKEYLINVVNLSENYYTINIIEKAQICDCSGVTAKELDNTTL